MLTRASPEIMEDIPPVRSRDARVLERLSPPLAPVHVCEPLRQIIVGSMREDPAQRISLGEVIRLGSATDTVAHDQDVWGRPLDAGVSSCLPGGAWQSLIDGIVRYLTVNLPRDSAAPLWPETAFGRSAHTCTVQHGLAGALAVLARLAAAGYGEQSADLRNAVLDRLDRDFEPGRHHLPGLYFGFAGTAWALFDAGRALNRGDLVDRALELVSSLPTAWPNADITHGLSGLGTCLLHLAQATGRQDLLTRALACGDEILRMADTRDDGISWTVHMAFDSELAGYTSYGFAHGTAGIGAFLLAAGHAAGRDDLLDAARRCGETLLAAALREGDAAFWPATASSSAPLTHWCNGSSGVGTFLCRLYARTKEPEYLASAVAAAHAVMRTRWSMGTAYCHGLAGDGDFLIDLSRVTGDSTFADYADELAGLLWARRVYYDGAAVLPDESGSAVTGGYGAGSAGHLSFLLRLRMGGPRLFHPDPCLERVDGGPQ